MHANPFEPPQVFDQPKASGLGPTYWLPLLGLLGLSIAVSFTSGAALGLFGLSTCVFAGYHGFMFQGRLIKRELVGDAVNRISDFALFICSMMLGTAATVAGLIAFAGTCVPASLLLVNFGGMRADVDPGMIAIWIACAGIAIFAVGWLIGWFLPRKPSNS